ncbi:protein MpCYP707D1 [Marchantia polymorpha subsp. ruderalis]
MEASILLSLLLGAVLLLSLSVFVHRQKSIFGDPRIPKGSDGWPLVGETLAFGNVDPMKFALPRIKKFGRVFKSHLLGTPSIMVATPEMAKFVYGERNLFRASYPRTITTLIGKGFLSSCDPHRHPFLKKVIQSVLLPDTLRHEVGRIEGYINGGLDSWDGKPILAAKEFKELTLNIAVYFIFGLTDLRGTAEAQVLIDMYRALSSAMYVMPINLPGFHWYKSLQARKVGCDYLKRLILERRREADQGVKQNTVLGALVGCTDEKGEKLRDDEIIDLLLGTLFGAHDTTATTITWIVKHLSEHHDVLQAVVAEQEEIRKSKAPGDPLTWEDTRRMQYSLQVIQETLRLPTVLQFTGREALEDIEFKGVLIPKGWRVFLMTTCIHLDAENFPNPLAFDPSRFQVPPKPGTYFPFASGTHVCPGSELAKLVILVFMHHLTTKFRWQSLQPDTGTVFKPFPLPNGGYPIKLERKVL